MRSRFDQRLYLQEMALLIDSAREKLPVEHPKLCVYTINIWTDPNPAGFAFPMFAKREHASFDRSWETKSKGRCWNRLEPALLLVGNLARERFTDLRLHALAELSVNSRRDWYDQTWPLKSFGERR